MGRQCSSCSCSGCGGDGVVICQGFGEGWKVEEDGMEKDFGVELERKKMEFGEGFVTKQSGGEGTWPAQVMGEGT